ncbi:putative inorganic carbon transporter subunit DabA [Leptonema illini]|uniref:putative inorganic carbon transporter subunit DabA n=1 Tax=Leptonema illini TaxID=183 RepID=UPI0002D799D0|nr:putative inorganic carbon transporter subunit DabA [Leptonema illini]
MIDDALHDEVEEALKCVAPSWPLQNTVAVNPFWFMKDRSFIEALSSLESATHASLVWPLDHYLKDLEGGRISEAALERALADESKVSSAPIPETIDELIEASRNEIHAEAGHPTTLILSCAEAFLPESRWNVTIINECGKHAAAYFDRRQAIAGLPSARNKEGFFESWKQEIRFDRSMDFFGLKGLRDCAREFAEASSREAIAVMLHELAIHSHTERVLYMQRLITTVIGWATHFRFHEWQAELTNTATHIQTEDLLAVRMIYDLACFRAANEMKQRRPEIDMAIAHWKKSLQAELHTLSLRRIWLRAAEYSFQDTAAVLLQGFTSSQASLPASGSPSFPELTTNASGEENPWMHVVFCIDVRSELLRRHLELSDSGIETSGFAGFFGMPVAYQKSTEARETSRLPALLAPAFHLEESAACRQNYDLRARTFTESYFRNLRKAPISSFLFVELFGILALGRVLRRNLTNLRRLFGIRVLPQRFRDRGFDHTDPYQRAGISHADRVQLAENALRRMGMRRFAPLIVLAGHGSVTANNAFGSSLDCGACGGHSGDINARLLASLLNDRDIRASLAERGVSIPDETVFVAAVHETVTDEIYLLDSRSSSARERNLLKRAQDVFAKASLAARKERQASRTRRPTALPHRRAHDWSEVRPSMGPCR